MLEPFLLKAEITLTGIEELPLSMATWASILLPTASSKFAPGEHTKNPATDNCKTVCLPC